MKKFLVSITILIGSLGFVGTAHALPKYCGAGAYNTSYRAAYAYPTGTYWQSQLAAYPDYYAAHNAFYQAKYGC